MSIIDKNGVKKVHDNWLDKDYAGLEITEGKPKYYLRFEYEHQGRPEWLYVIKNGNEWY